MSLYENINKKRKSGRKMRKKGDKGAPTEQNFADAAKTAKAMYGGKMKEMGKGGKMEKMEYGGEMPQSSGGAGDSVATYQGNGNYKEGK